MWTTATTPRRTTIAIAAAALLLTGASGTYASDATPPDRHSAVTAQLDRFAVPAAAQTTLLAKIDAGETWDSMTPGSLSVSQDERVIDGMRYTVDRYDDGSFGASALEAPSTARGIAGCSQSTSGTKRTLTNCTVSYTTGVITMSFKANYTYSYASSSSVSVSAGSITSAHTPTILALVPGSVGAPTVKTTKGTASSGSPATATAQAAVSIVGWVHGTATMSLVVPIGSPTLAHVTASF